MDARHDPRVAGSKALEEVTEELDDVVRSRRTEAGMDGGGPTWGLALSGGGIRSATFCLGLVRGLARNGLLRRFDYLSTVSGGGYLGSSLGRLYREGTSATEVEAGVARDDSMWLWWLRNNGRYLTPAGAKDLGYATASIVRGILATHLEIGILILAAASLVLLPHVVVALFPPLPRDPLWNYDVVRLMPSAWGWLLVLPAVAFVHQVCAYWFTRDRFSWASALLISLVAALGVFTMFRAWGAANDPTGGLADEACVATFRVVAALAVGLVTAWCSWLIECVRRRPAGARRLVHTKRLSYCMWAIAICLGLMLLDWSSWQLTRLFWTGGLAALKYEIGVSILVLVATARVLVPELQRWMATTKGRSLNLERVLNVVGLMLAALAALWWTTIFHATLFPGDLQAMYWRVSWTNLPTIWPVATVLVVLAACATYLVATRRSFDLLNLASLHNFYRARIERAYVSSGNSGAKGSRFPTSALDAVDPKWTMQVAPLTEATAGDDVDLAAYRPHEHGGPIHLINCCINQSVDDRTGLYNADRKGVALAVSGLGAETGTSLPNTMTSAPSGTLSQWVAISGAAASTGMGSQTSPGLAALLFMSGIRLGYWIRSLVVPATADTATPSEEPPKASWLLRQAPKPFAIVAESLARFPGLFSPLWYVSDGGHFDNTGIYALLKRRVKLIVAADCGADPRYLFGDLESLVRKAKIDYGASIAFVDVDKNSRPLCELVGTPEKIGPEPGKHWLVLGRITYADGTCGVLLVVKPRRLEAMPFDMVAYADRHPDYPQQSTGDQFFDESQWESYHQLGLMMGGVLTADLISAAEAMIDQAPVVGSSLKQAEEQNVRAQEVVSRRERVGLTVRASLGAGLSLSALVAAWQGVEQFRESRRAEDRRYDELAREIIKKVGDASIEDPSDTVLLDFKQQSMRRGDDRFDEVLAQLNQRCEAQDSPAKQACEALYRRLTTEPYDYWFADKHQARYQAEAGAAGIDAPPSPAVAGTLGSSGAVLASSIPPATTPEGVLVLSTGPSSPATEPPRSAVSPQAPCAPDARVFLHVYDEDSRAMASELADQLRNALGVTSAPIENVVATALRRGTRPPYVWRSPSIVTSGRTSDVCLGRARGVFHSEVQVRRIAGGRPDTIEIWISPRSVDSLVKAAEVSH